jgi:hypothetical protein
MAPDGVIELAKRIKAEQEAKRDVFTDVEESEAEAPECCSETVNRHGRHESRRGRVIPQTRDPMDIDENKFDQNATICRTLRRDTVEHGTD